VRIPNKNDLRLLLAATSYLQQAKFCGDRFLNLQVIAKNGDIIWNQTTDSTMKELSIEPNRKEPAPFHSKGPLY
jgi:hypothetical protein